MLLLIYCFGFYSKISTNSFFYFSCFPLVTLKYSKESIAAELLSKKNDQLGPYLAGLIEGIIIPPTLRNAKGKRVYPYIKVVFHINDYPLAQHLQQNLGGYFELSNKKTYVVWWVGKTEDLYALCKLINGYFRTPKIEKLHSLILYFNNLNNLEEDKLPILRLDDSPVDSNSWLSGFTDADGNFDLSIYTPKGKKQMRIRLLFRFDLQQISKTYKNSSFFEICSKIASLFKTSVYNRSRIRNNKECLSFVISTTTKESNELVCAYFDRFPLFSSKYLNYKDWREIVYLQQQNKKGKNYPQEYFSKALAIKANFNTKRTNFDWAHLESFYTKKNP